MKTIFVLLFLSLSNFAHAWGPSSCDTMFAHAERNVRFDYLMPEALPEEASLRQEAAAFLDSQSPAVMMSKFRVVKVAGVPKGDVTAERAALASAVAVSDNMEMGFRTILKNQAYKSLSQVELKKFTPETAKRIHEVSLGIVLRASDLLKAMGVNHDIRFSRNVYSEQIYSHIFINIVGDSLLNRLAARVRAKSRLFLSYSSLDLFTHGARGMWHEFGFNSETYAVVKPELLLNKSIYQNDVALHEYTHNVDLSRENAFTVKPYHMRISILKSTAESLALSGGYSRGMSLDELRAFRTTIRGLAHDAVTTAKDDNATFDKVMETLQMQLQREVNLSRLASYVLQKALAKDERDYKISLQTFSLDIVVQRDVAGEPTERYMLTQRLEPKSRNIIRSSEAVQSVKNSLEDAYEMTQFTSKTYTYLLAKFNEAKSKEDQLDFLNRLIYVITNPNVKRLDGNYPTPSKIEELYTSHPKI